MSKFGNLFVSKDKIISDLLRLAVNPFVILGLLFYGLGFLIWLKILTTFEVSKVYPIMVSVTTALVLIGSSIFLPDTESISFLRVFGVIVLMLGVFLVFRS
jgi:multidrug transporter EmrE-like cation transporter